MVSTLGENHEAEENGPLGSPPPPAKRSPDSSLSPEQQTHMEKSKLEAESKLIAKKFAAEELGISWINALLPEFKKPYMQEVSRTTQIFCGMQYCV